MNETKNDHNGDTISEAILRWLEANPSWWSRAEIALGVGRSKTSQLIRCLEALHKEGHLYKTTAREDGRDLYLYTTVHQYTEELPF